MWGSWRLHTATQGDRSCLPLGTPQSSVVDPPGQATVWEAPPLPPWQHLQLFAQSRWGVRTQVSPWLSHLCRECVDLTISMFYLWALLSHVWYPHCCLPSELLQDFHFLTFPTEVNSSSLWVTVAFKADHLLLCLFVYAIFHRAPQWILPDSAASMTLPFSSSLVNFPLTLMVRPCTNLSFSCHQGHISSFHRKCIIEIFHLVFFLRRTRENAADNPAVRCACSMSAGGQPSHHFLTRQGLEAPNRYFLSTAIFWLY